MIVTVDRLPKYAILIMRADNRGEAGSWYYWRFDVRHALSRSYVHFS
jgi:hypothetical protein